MTKEKGSGNVYLREKRIKSLKIKNVIFVAVGIFNIAISIFTMISLISHYPDDLETVLHAKVTPEAALLSAIGLLLLVTAGISKRQIGNANFYSGYFEGDLSGYIKYCDLAEVIGKRVGTVKLQLHLFHRIYMQGYELKEIEQIEQVVLNSKKCICECKHCGASIEKRIYFTGVCPYCGSSDLFAKVLADKQFYSIETKMSDGVENPVFYSAGNLIMKKIRFLVYLVLGLFVMGIAALICLGSIADYNNEEYLTKVLLSGESPYSSFALIKAEIMDTIIGAAVFVLVLVPVVFDRCRKIKYVTAAEECSQYFAASKTPFVDVENLPVIRERSDKKRVLKVVRGALRQRYLLNCTFEKHDGLLKVALAKKIVKDQCPTCGGAIIGAVDEHYQCRYCDNIIMKTIRKK